MYFLWAAVAVAAAIGLGGIALHRGEHINSLWLVMAAACSYATAYRFYGKFIAARVMAFVAHCYGLRVGPSRPT